METRNVSPEKLREIVGADHVRESTAADAVDGVEPAFVVEPGSVEEASEVMKVAGEEGLAVVPRGGGSKMGLGNPPRELDLIVSTARMNQILEYVPQDQVVRVQAGIKLEDLQETLSESNQMVALDPPETGATVGGVVATNASGPRRYARGTVRDLIIGIRVVLADGTVAKAGGKVVKNVAGYDLAKLFTGSLGTLGLIVEANFRLHPLQEASRTVAVEVESPQAAFEAVRAVKKSQVEPTAVELRYSEDRKLVVVLVESIPGGIDAKEEMVSFLLKPSGRVRTLSDEEAGRERSSLSHAGEDATVVRISAPPAELVGVMESVLGAAERRGLGHPEITGHAATGVTYVTLSGGETGTLDDFAGEVREIWVRRGGTVVLERAPVELKRRAGVWGPPADSIGLTRRVKEKFDPRGILSPGRFIGGI